MRTKYSLYNVISGMLSQVIIVLLGFVSRRVFVDTLGLEMQGVNGTLTTIISMLSLTELGIGTAIICNLYKPLAEDDRPAIVALMQLYSRIYKVIALIVAGLGLAVCPFLPALFALQNTGSGLSNGYLTAVFLLFLADVVLSYLFAYKRAIITADQKSFLLTVVTTLTTVLTSLAQIVVLLKTQNFVLYLVIKLVFRLADNLVVAGLANHRYPYIVTKEKRTVDGEIRSNIVQNTKALALHYIGNYMITGTDTLIITKFLGTLVSGVYSNYQMITQTLRTVLGQFSTGITASFGNLIATGDRDTLRDVFHKSFFIAFLMSNFSAVALLVLFNPFILLWLGKPEALLPMHVVLILVVNFYFTVLSEPLGTLRASAGLFRPDRYLHIALAVLNLVVSILLVKIPSVGIFGVFLGTFLCLCIKELTVLPYIVYKNIFGRSLWDYHRRLLLYTLVTVGCGALTWFAAEALAVTGSVWANLLIRAGLCLVIPNVAAVLLFGRTKEFRYVVELVRRIISKILHRNAKEANT